MPAETAKNVFQSPARTAKNGYQYMKRKEDTNTLVRYPGEGVSDAHNYHDRRYAISLKKAKALVKGLLGPGSTNTLIRTAPPKNSRPYMPFQMFIYKRLKKS